MATRGHSPTININMGHIKLLAQLTYIVSFNLNYVLMAVDFVRFSYLAI